MNLHRVSEVGKANQIPKPERGRREVRSHFPEKRCRNRIPVSGSIKIPEAEIQLVIQTTSCKGKKEDLMNFCYLVPVGYKNIVGKKGGVFYGGIQTNNLFNMTGKKGVSFLSEGFLKKMLPKIVYCSEP
jgi:hypothetical protein